MTRRPSWTVSEIGRLIRQRGAGMSFETIAGLSDGRTAAACQTKFYLEVGRQRSSVDIDLEAKRKRAARLLQASLAHAALTPAIVPPPRQIPPASGASMSTAVLMLDAELRNRIAEFGITAGLLGDPPPGRSALDKKRAGEA